MAGGGSRSRGAEERRSRTHAKFRGDLSAKRVRLAIVWRVATKKVLSVERAPGRRPSGVRRLVRPTGRLPSRALPHSARRQCVVGLQMPAQRC